MWSLDEAASTKPSLGTLQTMVGGTQIEFADSGRYKGSLGILEAKGTYRVSGDQVFLVGKDGEDFAKFRLSSDGQRLTSVPEFKSDGVAVFVRVPDQ